jgi:outer membrane protein TolC
MSVGWVRGAALAVVLPWLACAPPASQLAGDDALRIWRAASGPARADATAADSQPEAPAAEGLDAQTLVRRALAQDPGLRALRAEAAAIEASVGVSKEREDLELRLSRFRLDELRDDKAGVEIALRARPARPGEIRALVQSARSDSDEARAELRQAELALVAEVRRAHADLVYGAEEERIAREEAALREEERSLAQARLQAGAGTALDLALIELSRAELAADAALPDAASAAVARSLRAHLGLPPDAPLAVAGEPGGADLSVASQLDAEALVGEALAQHPTLNRASAQLAGASVEVWRAGAERWPWLSFVQAEYDAGPGSDALSFGFSLGLDIPIWKWSGASVRAARAQQTSRRLAFEAAVFQLAGAVHAALADVRVAHARLIAIETLLLPAAKAAADEASDARAKSLLDPMRALQLQTARLRARRLHAAARRDLAHALIALDEVVAREP